MKLTKAILRFKYKSVLLILLFTRLSVLSAQERSISGTITDRNGEPLIGASVAVKGTQTGTVANIEGAFNLKVPDKPNVQLVFTFIGYNPQTIEIQNQRVFNVILEESVEVLDEVVVVGYGQMRKSDLTGSVSSVNINESEAASATNIQSLMQGRASGVQITTGDAAPGAAVTMKIRGTSTLNASSEPLYVVDGIIMNSTMDQNATGGVYGEVQSAQNGLSGINPQDIESMEILKDASATAIYGSMGANGVVLITTKSGKTEKPRVKYQGSTTTSFLANKREMANLQEYAEIRSITLKNVVSPDGKEYMDWQDWATRQALGQNHRISISGKTDKTNYFLSGGFSSNEGIIKQTGNNQTDFRFNLDQNITNNLRIGTKTSFTYRNLNMTQGSDSKAQSSSGLIRQITTFQPYKPQSTDENESEGDDMFGPMPWLTDYLDATDEYRVLSSMYMNIKLNRRLSMRTTFGVDYRSRTRERFYGKGTWFGRQEGGYASASTQESQRINIDHMFNYAYRKKKTRLDATAGLTFVQSIVSSNLIIGRQFSTMDFREKGLMYSNNPTTPLYSESQTDLFSVLARAVYSYDNRYVLTSTFRADGTSKFAPGNKFSYFPSFAFAYRLDQEEFMSAMDAVSNAKLRLGWGMVGNQAISNYQTLSQYSGNIYVNSSGSGYYNAYVISNMTNPNLRWETTEQYNAGFDAGFFGNRLNFTVDLYRKMSHDLLQNIEMSMTSGYRSMAINRGQILNRGVEFTMDVFPVKTKKLTLNIAGNISFNKNKIIDIGLPVSQFGSHQWAAFLGRDIGSASYFKTPANIFIEGQPVALFYGIKVDGIVTKEEQDADRAARQANFLAQNPTATQVTDADMLTVDGTLPIWNNTSLLVAGDFRYVDVDGDGNIDGEFDKTIIGDPNPDFTYGFNIDLNYQNFYISAAFNGVYGNDIANSNKMMEEDINSLSSYNITKNIYNNYWREDRISNVYPRLLYTGDAGSFTSYYVEDGSFLRFSSLTVGYDFKLKKNKLISGVGLNFSARNLFILTKYTGYDPEVSSFASDPLRVGVDFASYPNNRSYSIGVSIDF